MTLRDPTDSYTVDSVSYSGSLGEQEQSLVRNPELLTSSSIVLHSTMTGSIGPQSPGTRADGSAF